MKIMRGLWCGLLVLALGSGCIKLNQTVEIKPDGSGVLNMTYGMSEQTIAQMESMKAMGGEMAEGDEDDGNPFDFDEEKLRAAFAEKGLEGVELLDVKSSVKEGWKYMTVRLAFENLAALGKTDFFEDNGLSLAKTEAGNYVLTQASADESAGEQEEMDMDDPAMQAMMQQMAPMFAGMRIEMTIKTPGKVISSNATEQGEDQVRWVYDVDADPSVISKMQKLSLRVEFDGTGLDLEPFTAPPSGD
ncbi:MAG: hypothetical protein K9N49_07210 [Candidatus Marinimicrobia bacterium]|nr:hypothetical protein [Candidatus Neomarinimicrobiota bacterium]